MIAHPEHLLGVMNAGLPRLQRIFPGLDQGFDSQLPLPTEPGWKQWLKPLLPKPKAADGLMPISLDPIIGMVQQNNSDCVGAVAMSILSTVTSAPITAEAYDGFLTLALRNRLAQEEGSGVRVDPFVLNVLMTPDFRNSYGMETTVTIRRDLTAERLAEVARQAREARKPHQFFALTPVASWKRPGTGHIVALQEIKADSVKVYDPGERELGSLSTSEFVKHWRYVNNSAILIFARRAR